MVLQSHVLLHNSQNDTSLEAITLRTSIFRFCSKEIPNKARLDNKRLTLKCFDFLVFVCYFDVQCFVCRVWSI